MSRPLLSRSSFTLPLVLVLALAGCDKAAPPTAQGSAASADPSAATQPASGTIDRSHAGEAMPALHLTGLNGEAFDPASIKGKPVLLNLWATWCAPCVKEMPLLDQLAGDEPQLQIITASQDLGGADVVAKFFAEHHFAKLKPWMDKEGELGFAFGGGLPVSILYDAQGKEVWRVNGDLDWRSPEVRAALDEGG
ncbi:TlpA disulfide reductase family protein [Qipengyuania algicida]|uniref:TlpA family protein disulfide reductase n=1 Tax=Qipengyuania algicida TaxID=1836209 RepID=UPI00301D22CA